MKIDEKSKENLEERFKMQLQKCTEVDRSDVLEFVFDEPAINLFIIGDIEAFGFEEPFQEVWMSKNEDDKIDAVLLRFNESFIPYWKNVAYDITPIAEQIKQSSSSMEHMIVSGKGSLIQVIQHHFPKLAPKPTYFCELNSKNKLHFVDKPVQIATEEDAQRIFELMETIEEFTISVPAERIAHKIKTGTGRIYFLEDEKAQVLSVVQTSAENSKSAMIVGVATRKEYRGQGLMSQCLTRLCLDLLEEGKSVCLFYDNPTAGAVYHRVGFETIGQWIMLK